MKFTSFYSGAEVCTPSRAALLTGLTRRGVVIVGGGFGGLYCARGLRRSPADVPLIDRRNETTPPVSIRPRKSQTNGDQRRR